MTISPINYQKIALLIDSSLSRWQINKEKIDIRG